MTSSPSSEARVRAKERSNYAGVVMGTTLRGHRPGRRADTAMRRFKRPDVMVVRVAVCRPRTPPAPSPATTRPRQLRHRGRPPSTPLAAGLVRIGRDGIQPSHTRDSPKARSGHPAPNAQAPSAHLFPFRQFCAHSTWWPTDSVADRRDIRPACYPKSPPKPVGGQPLETRSISRRVPALRRQGVRALPPYSQRELGRN